MKPLRGKRVDPQSRPGEFSSSEGSCGVTRRGPFAVNACRCCDLVRRRVHFLRARAPRPVSIGGQKIWRQVARRRTRFRRLGVIASGTRAVARPRTGRPLFAPVLACTFRPADTASLGQWPLTASCAPDRDAWAVPDGQWRIGR